MIIILEGIDKVGKSTLAKKLTEKYKATMFHTSAPKTKYPFDEYVSVINSLSADKNYVFDRFYLGELAYGEICRGKSGLSESQQFYIESLLLKFNPILVYCWLDYNLLTWNFHKEKEEITNIINVPKLDKIFRKVFVRSILHKVKYNYNSPKSVKELKDALHESNNRN